MRRRRVRVPCLAAILFVSCAGAAPRPVPSPTTASTVQGASTPDWPTATPAEVGLDANVLAAFDADIAAGKYGLVDSLLVIRHGRVAFERAYPHDYDRIYGEQAAKPSSLNALDPTGPYNYFNPWWHPYYRRGELHTLQSVTKTVTSVVIGTAVARHEFPSLDTPVLRFFDTQPVKNVDVRKRRMTIRHLLTMTAGLEWHEDLPYEDPRNTTVAMEASSDWVRFAIDQPMAEEPGTRFNYNSGATELLAHVFREATGHDVEEYAALHLFAPLGIERWFWKRTPTGLADTEGGLYLRPRDLAKIASLFLRGGSWDGRVVVDPAWVKLSLAPSVSVDGERVKYGYKWWLYRHGAGRWAWGGSGFGGQRPIVVPEDDLVTVVTGWEILGDGPRLTAGALIEHVLKAVVAAGR